MVGPDNVTYWHTPPLPLLLLLVLVCQAPSRFCLPFPNFLICNWSLFTQCSPQSNKAQIFLSFCCLRTDKNWKILRFLWFGPGEFSIFNNVISPRKSSRFLSPFITDISTECRSGTFESESGSTMFSLQRKCICVNYQKYLLAKYIWRSGTFESRSTIFSRLLPRKLKESFPNESF